MATMPTDSTVSEPAQVLFASALPPSGASTSDRIRAAVGGAFRNHRVAA